MSISNKISQFLTPKQAPMASRVSPKALSGVQLCDEDCHRCDSHYDAVADRLLDRSILGPSLASVYGLTCEFEDAASAAADLLLDWVTLCILQQALILSLSALCSVEALSQTQESLSLLLFCRTLFLAPVETAHPLYAPITTMPLVKFCLGGDARMAVCCCCFSLYSAPRPVGGAIETAIQTPSGMPHCEHRPTAAEQLSTKDAARPYRGIGDA